MKNKERLDVLLVSRGLCETRSKAQAVIMSGEVYVEGQKADKAGAEFPWRHRSRYAGTRAPTSAAAA